jgi:hypothetical protein
MKHKHETPHALALQLRDTLQSVIDQSTGTNVLMISQSNLGTLRSMLAVLENKIEKLYGVQQ